jgi:hypothetical protein
MVVDYHRELGYLIKNYTIVFAEAEDFWVNKPASGKLYSRTVGIDEGNGSEKLEQVLVVCPDLRKAPSGAAKKYEHLFDAGLVIGV